MLGLRSVSVPVLALLVVVLTQSASEQIASDTQTLVGNRATAVAGSVETYLGERQLDIRIVASSTRDEEPRHLGAKLADYNRINEAYDAFTIVRPDGTVVATSDPGSTRFSQTDQAWFREAVAGQQTFSLSSRRTASCTGTRPSRSTTDRVTAGTSSSDTCPWLGCPLCSPR